MRLVAGQGPGIVALERGDRPGVLRAIGEVDASNVDYFASVLFSESRPATRLTLDVSRLRFLGGEGLRSILRIARQLHDRGGTLHLVGPNRLVRRMFSVLRAEQAPGIVLIDDDAVDATDRAETLTADPLG